MQKNNSQKHVSTTWLDHQVNTPLPVEWQVLMTSSSYTLCDNRGHFNFWHLWKYINARWHGVWMVSSSDNAEALITKRALTPYMEWFNFSQITWMNYSDSKTSTTQEPWVFKLHSSVWYVKHLKGISKIAATLFWELALKRVIHCAFVFREGNFHFAFCWQNFDIVCYHDEIGSIYHVESFSLPKNLLNCFYPYILELLEHKLRHETETLISSDERCIRRTFDLQWSI